MNFHNDNLNRASGAHDTLLSKRGMAAKAAAFLCILAAMIVCGIMVGSNAKTAQAATYTAAEVQEMYDALPTAAEVDAMDNAGQNEVYTDLNTCYDAWCELTEAEQEAIGEEKFDELFEYFASGVVPAADSSTIDINYYWNYPGSSAQGNLYDTVSCSRTASSSTCLSPGRITYVRTLDNGAKSVYAFMGWSTSSSATSASYVGGDTLPVSGTDDISVYGVWNTVTIVFDMQGGDSIDSIILSGVPSSYASSYPISVSPSYSGHSFQYFMYKNASYAALADDEISASGNVTITATTLDDEYTNTITLVAYWTINATTTTYTITYSPGSYASGSSSTATTDTSGYLTLKGATYSRTNYTQTAWQDSNGTQYSLSTKYHFSKNTTLYPVWTENAQYCVTYKKGSYGTGDTVYSSYVYTGNSVTLKSSGSFSYTGHTQTGWSINQNGSTKDYNLSANVTLTSNLTLYPYWEANDYTITYKINISGKTSTSTQTETYGEKITLKGASTFSKTGYTITSWTTSSDGSGTSYSPGQEITMGTSMTLYAQWTANPYTIVFDKNGGSGTNMANQTLTYDTAAKLSANTYTKTGYHFLGWSRSTEAKTATYTDKESVLNLAESGTVTLYAVWEANTYYIEYLAPDATAGEMSTQEATYDANVTLYGNAYRRNGYTFKGWSTDGSSTVKYTDGQTIAKANLNSENGGTAYLYAVWQANSSTIVYDANGGTGAPASQKKYVDTDLKLSSTIPSRTGYTFKGWSTSEDSSIVSYTAGQTIKEEFSYSDGNTYTFYAVWVKADSNFDLTNVIDDTHMFYGDGFLTGGSGTEYDDDHIDSEYARIDGGKSSSTPGYFTGK